jgi:hypothetical protein
MGKWIFRPSIAGQILEEGAISREAKVKARQMHTPSAVLSHRGTVAHKVVICTATPSVVVSVEGNEIHSYEHFEFGIYKTHLQNLCRTQVNFAIA